MRVRAPARAGASLLPAVVAVLILLPPWAALAAPTVTVEVNGQILPLNPPAVLVDGRVLVPFRPLFEALRAEVHWDPATRTVTARRDGRTVTFRIGSAQATVDGEQFPLDVPAQVVGGSTLVPLRFAGEALSARVHWDPQRLRAVITVDGAVVVPPASGAGTGGQTDIKAETVTVNLDGRAVTARVVRIPRDAPLKAVVGLGGGRVGGVEELAAIAARHNAVVAVNGTFFNPQDYVAKNGLPMNDPWGTIVKGGRVLHVGHKATVGFDGLRGAVDQVTVTIEGATNGSYRWPNNWYAYGFNHYVDPAASSAVYIYTPERGETVGFTHGTKVVVRGGTVTSIVDGADVAIPRDGFVIVLWGTDGQALRSRFTVGTTGVEYRVTFTTASGQAWNFREALSAGPQLLKGGTILTDYPNQGFTEGKILTDAGRRSAIGFDAAGNIILAVVDAVRVSDLARIMKELGAVDAMNLDGGASSGLWVNGEYVVRPGRNLSNALLFVPAR